MNVLPLFKTHYSLGKAILTLNPPEKELDPNYPISIFDIAKKHNLKQIIVVDDSISGFLEAHQNAHKAGLQLVYGLKLRCVNDIEAKSEATLKTVSKLIVFITNNKGYEDLIKIASCAAKKGFYYKPNIDWKHLAKFWTPNLRLAIPFYDSFVFKNVLYGHVCVPQLTFTNPTFFIENSELPFDRLIQEKTRTYADSVGATVLPARSIYYYKRDDFLAYLTFRCIHERTNLEKPEIEHCSSDSFCFEEWVKQEASPESVRL